MGIKGRGHAWPCQTPDGLLHTPSHMPSLSARPNAAADTKSVSPTDRAVARN